MLEAVEGYLLHTHKFAGAEKKLTDSLSFLGCDGVRMPLWLRGTTSDRILNQGQLMCRAKQGSAQCRKGGGRNQRETQSKVWVEKVSEGSSCHDG